MEEIIFSKATLGGFLRYKYNLRQNFKTSVPSWVQQKYRAKAFRYISSSDKITVLRLRDGGIGGYRVPAKLVDENLNHVKKMEGWVEEYVYLLPHKEDETREILCTR